MNGKKNNKKYIFIVIGIIVSILLVVGVTYAYWLLTRQQEGENVVSTSCLNISFTGENDITLDKAYPMADEKLEKFLSTATPYHFTIHNECDSLASASINLESLNVDNEKRLDDQYIDVLLYQSNYKANLNNKKKLTVTNDENKVLSDSIHAYSLYNFTLDKNETREFNLLLYMDQDTPRAEENMNASWKGKITLSASYKEDQYVTIANEKIPIAYSGDGLYEVTHDVTEISEDWNKTEYRYAGENPNNYISFNNEIWRIIGLVNVKVGENIEQRVKIGRVDGVKNQKDFGNYSWDYGDGSYYNNWVEATLKDMLNGIYYESGNGECYKESLEPSECDFNSGIDLPKGLDDKARNMVDKDVIWNLGGWETSDITVFQSYEKERGISTGNGNKYPVEWSNETDNLKHNGIGLIYPSDYAYSIGGTGRSSCFPLSFYSYYDKSCNNNVWLKPINGYTWTLFPASSNSVHAFRIIPAGGLGNYMTSTAYSVWPTLYLKSTVKITPNQNPEQEYGTVDNPFQLSNE